MRKLFQGLSGDAWGVLIGKWMRERASVLEVEETANVVFAFSEEAGSGEPNPGQTKIPDRLCSNTQGEYCLLFSAMMS